MLFFPPLQQATPLPFVSPALGSHMVMQRGRPNAFWGWSSPGSAVEVEVEGNKASGVAGKDGKWLVRVMPPSVGGPYNVHIQSHPAGSLDEIETTVLTDVMVGDVWLCTGQSNMEFGLAIAMGGPGAVAAANDPDLRLFMVPKMTALQPQRTNGGMWDVCTPETVAKDGWGGFSAVGYFFGRKLRQETGVPIGLVEDCWGGTNAESWADRETVGRLKDFNVWFPRIDAGINGGIVPYATQAEAWMVANDPGSKNEAEWSKTDLPLPGWTAISGVPSFDSLGQSQVDGVAWFRREFEVPEAMEGREATLKLGAIDDADTTFLNGSRIGETMSYNAPRTYKISAGGLNAGRNMLAVRVLDTGGFGGFSGPAEAMTLTLADGTQIPLGDGWKGRFGVNLYGGPPYPMDLSNNPNVPTVLYNGMIAPELPLGIKGAIWYQGENNAGRAEQYRRVLPAMIGDWRKQFGQGDFPFYIVSLAAFTPHKDAPGDDEWAELREAQALTAKNVKNSGLALAIDVGDAADIHPIDKQTVGERLALIALARDYGKSIVYQGPTYRSMSVEGSEATLKFDHAEGLMGRGGAPGEFSVAGVDRKWHWATARIEGDTVIVSSSDVSKPVAVRYAWQSNPVANLYNGAGLPTVPFRTDSWPMLTAGRK
ncbi:sialate O-acetylesterase [soil metagenome]